MAVILAPGINIKLSAGAEQVLKKHRRTGGPYSVVVVVPDNYRALLTEPGYIKTLAEKGELKKVGDTYYTPGEYALRKRK